MSVLTLPLLLLATLSARLEEARERGSDRGDVPGWVLITLMTAGIVTVLWAFAGPRLVEIVQTALDNVAPAG